MNYDIIIFTNLDVTLIDHCAENRYFNKYQWNKTKLFKIFKNKNSLNCKIYTEINKLLKTRTNQTAFHPNSTQFFLNLGDKIFDLCIQNIDRIKSIFFISNITSKKILSMNGELEIKLNESFWISNKIVY